MGYPHVPNRHARQTAFLTQLARGKSAEAAAAHAGVPVATFYTWRRKHTRFREAWKAAAAYGRTPPFPPPSVLARGTAKDQRPKIQVVIRSLAEMKAEQEAARAAAVASRRI